MDPMFGNARRTPLAWLLAGACAGCSVDVAGTGQRSSIESATTADANGIGAFVGESADAGIISAIDATASADADVEDPPDPTLDADAPIDDASGVHVVTQDAGTDGGAHDAAHHSDADAAADHCDFTGSYAVDLLFDVTWNSTSLAGIVQLLKAGEGQIHVTLRVDLTGAASAMNARLSVCGVTLPDFATSNALVAEDYSAYFIDSAWDSPSAPHADFVARFGCAAPGCAMNLDQVIATFGARTGPSDVWPGRTGDINQIVPVDHDGDGYPAMSLYTHGGELHNAAGRAYDHIPVTWTLGARTTHAGIPFRVVADALGRVDSCDALSGAISDGSVEARAVSCRAVSSSSAKESECTPDQVTFLDQNLPDWTMVGGSFRAKRIANDALCADARAAWK